MSEKTDWKEIANLPPEAQRQVMDFIAFLRDRYAPGRLRKAKQLKLDDEPFVGMWQDRDDLKDSTRWVRETRAREWMSRRAGPDSG